MRLTSAHLFQNLAAKPVASVPGTKATDLSPRTTATAEAVRRTAQHPPPSHTESANQPDPHYSPESSKILTNRNRKQNHP
ncbi:hypothetical protein PGT21_017227 [Puccinia graminis f. sp. tritici]|uniref:Uncharacterized protein n=1 Tax=Puccinia graminis f. sp. tritici TaxID=56615 RepID=A0A5B0P733_PUCGR|nr:hypothetical protein PGT21_017227 [Puccinia graminis f. sp. tritici]